MRQITASEARARRLAAGLPLSAIAVVAGCAPATVRCWEFGVVVRPVIVSRLLKAYARLLEGAAPSDPPEAIVTVVAEAISNGKSSGEQRPEHLRNQGGHGE